LPRAAWRRGRSEEGKGKGKEGRKSDVLKTDRQTDTCDPRARSTSQDRHVGRVGLRGWGGDWEKTLVFGGDFVCL